MAGSKEMECKRKSLQFSNFIRGGIIYIKVQCNVGLAANEGCGTWRTDSLIVSENFF